MKQKLNDKKQHKQEHIALDLVLKYKQLLRRLE